MTPEIAGAGESIPPSGMSEVSRIAGVFFEPSKTFADVAVRPTWLVPLLLTIIMAVAMTAAFSQRVGWERMMRQQIEASSRTANMPAEQKEQIIQTQARFAPIFGYVFSVIGLPIYLLIAAGVLTGIAAGILSAGVRFKQVFAIMAYSSLTSLVSVPLSILVMFLKNPDDFDIRNPLMFNPGAFMDPINSSKFLYSLASSLDLIVFWNIFLIATGLKAAAGKKLSFGGALMAVIVPWAIYVLGKSALAGLFS
jgi:hypothetical protein